MVMVLVIDDDKLIRWSLREIFLPEGYHVDAAATVEEALHHAKEKSYHLIFSDVEISNENGLEMLNLMNGLQPNAKIIILSAFPKAKIEPQLKNLKTFSILEKPFRAESIRDRAREALRLFGDKNEDMEELS